MVSHVDFAPYVEEEDLKRVEARLKSINASAQIQRSERSAVSVDSVLGLHAFDLKKTIEMDPEFLNTDNEHEHDNTVSSISCVETRALDLDTTQQWINSLIRNKGADLYRMKGVLNIAHADSRFMFQAVHMIFNGEFDEPWQEDEERKSQFVFIGKNLDHDELKKGFEACILTPELLESKVAALRFKLGDKVECKTSAGWLKGTIVNIMWRDDESMPTGMTVPYQIKLDDGDLIYAPFDDDEIIRSAGEKRKGTA